MTGPELEPYRLEQPRDRASVIVTGLRNVCMTVVNHTFANVAYLDPSDARDLAAALVRFAAQVEEYRKEATDA